MEVVSTVVMCTWTVLQRRLSLGVLMGTYSFERNVFL